LWRWPILIGGVRSRCRANARGERESALSRHLRSLKAGGLIEEAHPVFDARVRIYTLMAKVGRQKSRPYRNSYKARFAGRMIGLDGLPVYKLKLVATVRKVLLEPKL
jgi:DNA-binding transcriptional ArsR family regulator